ncbi:acyltransferase [Mesorhizobium sp. CA18]|uniref:acyltransferase family protein n=1 Tax=unclassified Mesorhizobium TaxID=325217 RepID=UPI001CCE934D|nr:MULTISPECIES: acyltransferase family protein [unclassified Mesorhizobium]MBZ9735125.1 acyltransferase [Mesorhizobium sp. CA9]MBZ9828700.1 acyltransferase [Mesorhizobium sp. CA18]MBZ9833102.1 acyltransferase [Mesorhizobium sp. CA2]MBZ9839543.1 acyltransferase [Mesorhizobium sp. CA3]MBZ9879595.1 acyltransferase [Mesorhizobium sp. Ca11]
MRDDIAPGGFRPEIQGLRGLAVAFVVIFHIWPAALPGGYVGVDIFFVISGFLITGLLTRMALSEDGISLVGFYTRRVRRLLPAAIVALLVTLAGTLLFVSDAWWEETAKQVIASALYMQNWRLAEQAVDYLGAEDAPSPVQHFWSLSIEEQFYIVWPLLMLAVLWWARRRGHSPMQTLVFVLGVVMAGSLAASVALTRSDPAWAYFVTHTRVWELALGGLLALTSDRFRPNGRVRTAMVVAGSLAALASAMLFSRSTDFPGFKALLPTLGTTLIIAAGSVRMGRFRGLDIAMLRYIGDRSYSIYLWHWPLIIFYAAQRGAIDLVDGVLLIVVTLMVSELSYRFVEQPYRHSRSSRAWRPLIDGTVAVGLCVAVAGGLVYAIDRQPIDTGLIGTPNYPGPAALLANAVVPQGVKPLPPLSKIGSDVPVIYRMKCHQQQKGTDATGCQLGDPAGTRTIVVMGDSHAAQWVPAIDKIAKDRKWRLVTFTKAACPVTRVTILDDGKPYEQCALWREKALAEIAKLKPDFVITSQSNYTSVTQGAMIEGLRSVWGELTSQDVRVVAIRNTPFSLFDPRTCLGTDPAKCINPRAEVERENIYALAARSVAGVTVVDMNDALCGKDSCPAVVGNIVVLRDNHHLTATYALALAPYLAKAAGF